MSSAHREQLRVGSLLEGKYKLERQLGEGGMGQVFLARDTSIDRLVAIKLLHDKLAGDHSVRERFKTEAKAIARLRHSNCVMLYEFGVSDDHGVLYAVFEYVQGQSLEKWVGKQIPIVDVLALARQVADGMEHAHSQKIIHRDLKPDNIMVVVDEDGDLEFKVLDFGIARIAEDDTQDEGEDSMRLTKAGQMFGTPPYMSPEQIRARLDLTVATDIYSIGVILYEMIEGRLPFLAETPIETVMMHLNEEVPPMERSGVPEELRQIVMRCLEKDPADRFASCKELSRAIQKVAWKEEQRDSMLDLLSSEGVATAPTEMLFAGPVPTPASSQAPETLPVSTAPETVGPEKVAVEEAASADFEERTATLAPREENKRPVLFAVVAVLLFFGLSAAVVAALLGGEASEEAGAEEPVQLEATTEVAEPEQLAEVLDQEEALEVEDVTDEVEVEVAERLEEGSDDGGAAEPEAAPTPRSTPTPTRTPTPAVQQQPREASSQSRSEREPAVVEQSGAGQAGTEQTEQVGREDASPASLRIEQRRRAREDDGDQERPSGIRLPGRD